MSQSIDSVFAAMAARREKERLEEEAKKNQPVIEEEVVEEATEEVVEEETTEEAPADVEEQVEEEIDEEVDEEEDITEGMDPEIVEAMQEEGMDITVDNYNAVVDALNAMDEAEEEEDAEVEEEDLEEPADVEEQGGGHNFPGGKSFMNKDNGTAHEPAKKGSSQAVDQTPSKPNIVARGKKVPISIDAFCKRISEEYEVTEETAKAIYNMAFEDVVEEETPVEEEKACPKCGKNPCKCEENNKKASCSEKCEENEETEESAASMTEDVAELQVRLEECGGSQYMMDALLEGKIDMVKKYLGYKEV